MPPSKMIICQILKPGILEKGIFTIAKTNAESEAVGNPGRSSHVTMDQRRLSGVNEQSAEDCIHLSKAKKVSPLLNSGDHMSKM